MRLEKKSIGPDMVGLLGWIPSFFIRKITISMYVINSLLISKFHYALFFTVGKNCESISYISGNHLEILSINYLNSLWIPSWVDQISWFFIIISHDFCLYLNHTGKKSHPLSVGTIISNWSQSIMPRVFSNRTWSFIFNTFIPT